MTSPPLSRQRMTADLIFVSGQLPRDADGRIVAGGIETQTLQVLSNLSAALAEVGAGLADVVKTTVWLTCPSDLAGFNAAYSQVFKPPYPARSTVVSALVADGALIELEAIACRR